MERIKLKDLRRAEYNPRIMPADEMQALKTSILTYGFVEPVVVNSRNDETSGDRRNVLIGGHQRTTAVEELLKAGKEIKSIDGSGDEALIPATVVDLDIEQEQALNLALNKIKGRWDESKLADIIFNLRGSQVLSTSGFSEHEVSKILDSRIAEIEEEESGNDGELAPEYRSKPGEVYELGPHRLICGDCTDPEVWAKLMQGKQASMIFTDPPYNVDYHSRGDGLAEGGADSIMNDNLTPEQFQMLISRAFYYMINHAQPGAAFYVCSGWSSYPTFLQALQEHGFEHSGVIIWVKNVPSMGWNDYRYKHEWILKLKKGEGRKASSMLYGWKGGAPHKFNGENEYDVWDMPRKSVVDYIHPTEKPDWLAMRAIRNSTDRGDIVVDCFGGSGSTMAAAEKTGRKAYMIELDPKFCDRIRKRWEKLETLSNKLNPEIKTDQSLPK